MSLILIKKGKSLGLIFPKKKIVEYYEIRGIKHLSRLLITFTRNIPMICEDIGNITYEDTFDEVSIDSNMVSIVSKNTKTFVI